MLFLAIGYGFLPDHIPTSAHGQEILNLSPEDSEGEARYDADGFPLDFSDCGRIERISATELVINDTLYRFASTSTFNTRINRDTEMSSFDLGDYVGIMQDHQGKIRSLWLIKEGEEPKKSSNITAPPSNRLVIDNEVWRNY